MTAYVKRLLVPAHARRSACMATRGTCLQSASAPCELLRRRVLIGVRLGGQSGDVEGGQEVGAWRTRDAQLPGTVVGATHSFFEKGIRASTVKGMVGIVGQRAQKRQALQVMDARAEHCKQTVRKARQVRGVFQNDQQLLERGALKVVCSAAHAADHREAFENEADVREWIVVLLCCCGVARALCGGARFLAARCKMHAVYSVRREKKRAGAKAEGVVVRPVVHRVAEVEAAGLRIGHHEHAARSVPHGVRSVDKERVLKDGFHAVAQTCERQGTVLGAQWRARATSWERVPRLTCWFIVTR